MQINGINTIGVPKEIKNSEGRVGLRPSDVEKLSNLGYTVFVEKDAGEKCGFSDQQYSNAKAIICDTAEEVYTLAHLIVKVKEPQESEYKYLDDDKFMFCYFHFASNEALNETRFTKNYFPIPYEQIVIDGETPLLKPMSEIAGKLSIQKGAEYLSHFGKLIGGSTGVPAANVLIIGGGVAGKNAAKIARGMGANTCILDKNPKTLESIYYTLPGTECLLSSDEIILEKCSWADLIVCAVHSVGKQTDKLINDKHFDVMKKNSILIDISIDQGGCTSASKPTTHENPTYVYKNTLMYCVANMPGLTNVTSTHALCNASFPILLDLLNNPKKYYNLF